MKKRYFLLILTILTIFAFGTLHVNAESQVGDIHLDGTTIIPKEGEVPNEITIPENNLYEIVYQRWDEDGVEVESGLEVGKTYDYNLILMPKNGVTFVYPESYIHVDNIDWDDSATTIIEEGQNNGIYNEYVGGMMFSASYTVSPYTFDASSIYPEFGEGVKLLNIPDTDKYEVYEAWGNLDEQAETNSFNKLGHYQYAIILTPINNYEFTYRDEIKVNGINWVKKECFIGPDGTPFEGQLIFGGAFDFIEEIDNIALDLSGIIPSAGGAPVDLVIDKDLPYEIEFQQWTDSETKNPTNEFDSEKEYIYSIVIRAKDGFGFVNDPLFVIDGFELYLQTNGEHEGMLEFVGIYEFSKNNTYNFTEGDNLKTSDLTKIRFRIDADYLKFLDGGKVFVDGVEVSEENFTTESGSTIITFKEEYTVSLAKGIHKLKVLFNDGEANTEFTIEEKTPEVVTSEPENNPQLEDTAQKGENPQTGDNVILYIILGLISAVGITGATIYTKKDLTKNI